MMRPLTILLGALLISACSRPAASNNSSVEPAQGAHTATASHTGPRQTAISKGTHMLPMEVLITSERGPLSARLADNDAARALAKMLPLQIKMRDHLRQEKTGVLPSALPGGDRQAEFSVGTLGLWGDRDFVIYYRDGRVPEPGIVVLGQVSGDLSMFDNPDEVTISLRRAE